MLLARLRRHAVTALLALVPLAVQAADLTVSAAASLSNALRELGPLFEARNPGMSVVFNFGASDTLLAQIARGAPADVFASADQETMDRADAQKLLTAGSRRNFVANTLVMIVPGDSTLGLRAPADLQKPGVERFAIGNPASVPAGRYARRALEALRLWGAVEPKVVLAQNVRQALDYVARLRNRCGHHERQGESRGHGADRHAHHLPDRVDRRQPEPRGGAQVPRLRADTRRAGCARTLRLRQTVTARRWTLLYGSRWR
jgi:molybdate transport system substrate-binding protein